MLLKEVNNGDVINQKGIFQYLVDKVKFINLIDSKLLDIDYYYNHSGDKLISPLFYTLTNIYPNIELVYTNLADVIVMKYGDKWQRLYDAFVVEIYAPLENYRMVENEKVNSKITNSRDAQSSTYGFNSNEDVPTDKGIEKTTSEGSSDDNNRELTRSGNIGVTTSQQMLQSEIELRKWNFYKSIMHDVDSILTLNYYG